jgi:hypothetical protein
MTDTTHDSGRIHEMAKWMGVRWWEWVLIICWAIMIWYASPEMWELADNDVSDRR